MLIRKYCGCILKKTSFSNGVVYLSCGRPGHTGVHIFNLRVDAKSIKKKDLTKAEISLLMKGALLQANKKKKIYG